MRPTPTRDTLAELEGFDQQTYDLAVRLAGEAADADGAVVVLACCWLLAGLIDLADRQGHRTIEDALALVMRQIRYDVDHFRKPGIH
jgi:hypothetical protein